VSRVGRFVIRGELARGGRTAAGFVGRGEEAKRPGGQEAMTFGILGTQPRCNLQWKSGGTVSAEILRPRNCPAGTSGLQVVATACDSRMTLWSTRSNSSLASLARSCRSVQAVRRPCGGRAEAVRRPCGVQVVAGRQCVLRGSGRCLASEEWSWQGRKGGRGQGGKGGREEGRKGVEQVRCEVRWDAGTGIVRLVCQRRRCQASCALRVCVACVRGCTRLPGRCARGGSLPCTFGTTQLVISLE
jgi:hypothetical protein